MVGEEVGKSEDLPMAMLLGPEEVALASDPQVFLGDLESVIRLYERLQPIPCRFSRLVPAVRAACC